MLQEKPRGGWKAPPIWIKGLNPFDNFNVTDSLRVISFDGLKFGIFPFCKLFSYFNVCNFQHKDSTFNYFCV